ncbi:Peptidoglycan/LPS O-acetylase OafA/YrhL, contains acyltransferase and SGNH-hydrolase domains [Leifsonia sp. CL147]|nr:Peptidoglycan/LPS O-acetylase OafA/YrhL, contains acyltransferase and SGNH-hydrolase domains [Leifsonia sp. CL154]SFM05605.1 Peptidoglycan/LPS O-acetylase OafA/YrhL, contains acyltransferase and SGNH-hydrolase domains [Leifsonia sp. CL147]
MSVLLYHVFALNWSTLQDGVYLKPAANPLANLLIFSPLHVVWLGAEAVFLFFVLSGFVLVKAATRPEFSWPAYYPSRIVRLYGPVLGAIVLAWLGYVLLPHTVQPGASPQIAGLPTTYSLTDILHDATLLGGTSNAIGTLWSLQWEVVFSLALPAYLLLVRRYPIPASIIALAVCLLGWANGDLATSYLPMFFFGALLAQYWDRVTRAFRFLTSGRWYAHPAGVVLTVLAVTAMTSYFVLGRSLEHHGIPARVATIPIVLVGIVLLVVLGTQWRPLSRLLTTRVLLFLGTISFSLYLVHRPIMIAVAFLMGTGLVPAVVTAVVAIAVATGFYFAAERPIHRLSQRIARSVRAGEAVPARERALVDAKE